MRNSPDREANQGNYDHYTNGGDAGYGGNCAFTPVEVEMIENATDDPHHGIHLKSRALCTAASSSCPRRFASARTDASVTPGGAGGGVEVADAVET